MTLSMSPKQNSSARSIPNPSVPLRMTLAIIERGTFTAAFSISSDIYEQNEWRS